MWHEQITNKSNSQNPHDLDLEKSHHNFFIVLLITSGEATSNWQKVI
jgi:hypothetical protein